MSKAKQRHDHGAEYLPVREAQGGAAARTSVIRATAFVGLVRDEGPCAIGAYLDELTPDQMYGLVVTLAAMVPEDRSPKELLAWLHQAPATPVSRSEEKAS